MRYCYLLTVVSLVPQIKILLTVNGHRYWLIELLESRTRVWLGCFLLREGKKKQYLLSTDIFEALL